MAENREIHCQAVVFDMDGVIFDSERLVLKSWKKIGEKYGYADIENVFYRCIGVNTEETKKIVKEYYGSDFPYDTYKAETSKWFHDRYDNGRLPLKPGVRELLDYLKEKNVPLAVASSTREAVVLQELMDAGLLPYFERIIGGDMVRRSKPEPDIFLKACEKLGVTPEMAIVIEDSFNGIRAAKRAGMIPVMVPDLLMPDEAITKLAYRIFPSLREVKAWLQRDVFTLT